MVLAGIWGGRLPVVSGVGHDANSVNPPLPADITKQPAADKPQPSDPNALPQGDKNADEEGDSFAPKLSTLVIINEAYERIFTPELITSDGLVRYGTLRRLRSDMLTAARHLKTLHPAVLMGMSKEERIAFWLNTYNVCMLQLIIDNYPIQPKWYMILYPDNSVMQIDKPWTNHFFWISEEQYNLKEIRTELLLARYADPRLCFALSYATRGGATLRDEPYKAQILEAQLNGQVQKFISRPDGVWLDKDSAVLYLSSVFSLAENKSTFLASDWANVKKFRGRKTEERAWLNFIHPWLPEADARYLETNAFTIKFLNYDWHLNEAP